MTKLDDKKRARSPTKRMTVSLKPAANEILQSLSSSSGLTFNECLNKAVMTEGYLQQEIEKGGKVYVQRSDNQIIEVVFR